MRTFLVSLLLIVSVATLASAEMLVTANPIGQGKWAVEGAGLMDSGQQFSASGVTLSSLTVTQFGGYVGYGLTDKLDLFLNAGTGSVGGFPATILGISTAGLAVTMTSLGLNVKYQVLDEMANSPVSVAVGAGYKSINSSVTNPTAAGGGTSTSSSTQMMVGAGVSKIMAPLVPYGGLTYRSTSSSGTTVATQLDLTVGSAIAWSMQGAVLVEYTMQSITPNGGTAYSSGQIGLGVAYKI